MVDKLVSTDSPGAQDVTLQYDLAEKIAYEIEKCIKEEFSDKHLTGLLAKSIKIEKTFEGFDVVIDPIIYDIGLYLKQKVIVQKKAGSYSSDLNNTGSPWHNHKSFIYGCIEKAIGNVLKEEKINAEVSGIK